MREKILLDTDIGSDIDDAVCLAYLLAQPDCDLLGITTVTGEARERAMLASALVRSSGKNVPIFPGTEKPLLTVQREPVAQQAAALGKWPHQETFPEGEWLTFMRDAIMSNPGEVTLLAIGPMTNLGLLFAFDPELPKLLKRLVLMCGVFTSRLANVGPLEWNALCDPYATAIVYQAAAGCHRSVGLDVTCQVTMPADEVRKSFKSSLLAPVLDFAGVWFEKVDHITFHDPLAAVSIFDDQLLGFEKGRVDVELASARLQGMTHWTDDTGGPHEAAMSVSSDRFFEDFFKVF